jgi:hypothetical protein
MGMAGCFVAIDDGAVKRFREDPDLLGEFLGEQFESDEPTNTMDVDKSWHCIHFMLTGQADGGSEPLAWAILGGEEIGEDAGYGPARILMPEHVKDISSALLSIGKEEFASRFNPVAMQAADVYLSEMCVRDGEEALEYIVENYLNLVDFYRGAAERGDGAILLLC